MKGSKVRRASDMPIAMVPSRSEDLELASVLAGDQLQTVFQPQFDLADNRLIGAEALARLPGQNDADGLFERAAAAGLAERLSRQMQRDALRQAAQWGGALQSLGLSINIRPQDIGRANYADWLASEVAGAGFAFARVTIEITEDSVIKDFAGVSARLDSLRALGMKVALDDFGTGFASLEHLACLPLDLIKLDRGLIAGLESSHRKRAVVRAMLRLAGDLGLGVVVEGVETAVQLDLLREWGCNHYQGFIRARPMPLPQFRQFAALHL